MSLAQGMKRPVRNGSAVTGLLLDVRRHAFRLERHKP